MTDSIIAKRKYGYIFATVCLLAVIVIWVAWCLWLPHTTIILLRHADRQGSQDLLSQEGVDRAAELVHVLEKSEISAIYHSEFFRTRRTAQDIADHLGILPVQISADDVSGLVNAIIGDHAGETVMVASHSNRVADIIEELGGGPYPDIDHDEYDNLFVIHTCQCWWRQTTVTNLQYGALSP